MYFLRDAMGSTIALTDANGNLSTQYTYEPFGKASASGPASSNEFQWIGRENDATGLTYLRARYYNPTLQRFMSQDPLRFGGGDPNQFAYSHNNPTTFSDPFGLSGGGVSGVGAGGGVPYGGLQDYVNHQKGNRDPGPGDFFPGSEGDPALGPYHAVVGGVDALLGAAGSADGGPALQSPRQPPRTPPASVFADCLHENLLTGLAAPIAPLCIAGGGVCVVTGLPPACVVGGSACLYGILVEAHCTAKARGAEPPELPEPPFTDLPNETR
jgi:RHS repeat-associated protein